MIRILLSILLSLFICQDVHAQRVTSPPQRIRFGTTLPSTCTNGMLFQDTDATAGQQIYACESGAWVLQGDGGSGSGDNITVNTTAATNANFLDNLYIDWAIDTAATPDDVTAKFNYAETLAGNPALLIGECVLTIDGIICEGTTADAIEMKLAFPDPATTDKTITLPNATDTLVGKDTTDTLTNKTMAAASNVLDADTAVALAADPADCATSTHFAVGVLASGAATCEAIGDADIPDSATVTGWVMGASTATTPSADDNDTSLATTAYVQTEINAMGGRSLTAASGSMDADAELYTDEKCITIETPTDADNFLFYRVAVNSTITAITCIVEAATSAVILVQECDTAGDNCSNIDGATTITCDVDGQADDGALSNAAIDATDWIRLDVGTVTGTVGHLTTCITETRDD